MVCDDSDNLKQEHLHFFFNENSFELLETIEAPRRYHIDYEPLIFFAIDLQ